MKAYDSSQEIELGGPVVAIQRVEESDAVTGDEIVVQYPLLGRDIDLVEADVRRAHFEWQCQRVRRETLQVGNPELDDQPASESEVPSRVPETLDLLVLRRQVRDGVVHEIDQREASGHPG